MTREATARESRFRRDVQPPSPASMPPASGHRPHRGRRAWRSAFPLRAGASRARGLSLGLLVSLTTLSLFVIARGSSPNGAWAPGSSDHISHWSSAVVFWYRGVEIWRQPMYRVCPGVAATPELAGIARGDTCTLSERGERRPLVTNWRQFARPYPPLWVAWSALEGLIYETTTLSFIAVNKLAVLKCLVAAHVLTFLLGLAWLVRPAVLPAQRAAGGQPETGPVTAAGCVLFFIAATEAMRWSLLGYYDVASIALVVAGMLLGASRRPGVALLALAAAIALHFRALWYLPLAGVAAAGTLGYGPWALPGSRRLGGWQVPLRGDLVCAGIAGLLLGSSALVLWALRPTLAVLPVTNIVYRGWLDMGNAAHVSLTLAVGLALGLIVADRALLLLIALAWQLGFVALTPQVMPWHSLFVLPMAVLARGYRRSEMAVLLVYVAEAALVFGTTPLSGDWLSAMVRALR